ncbi:MAG: hypothetical protein LBQ02_01660, partial [Candidatus Nomurabacteria bacterium]|nr:hypothetical protein [Candidatus Nomurabacteria bacterium]
NNANITDPTSQSTTITCETPAAAVGTYRTVVKTWGGTTPDTPSDDYTYETPYIPPDQLTPTNTWVKAADSNTAAINSITGTSATNFTVDLDANMIPIVNKADDDTHPSRWCNYDEKQWCNAVTLNNTTQKYDTNGNTGTLTPLAYYKDYAPAGTIIAEEDILGYWTYIPRYKYQVTRYDANNDNTNYRTPTPFNIQFQKATDAKAIPTAYTGTGDYQTNVGADNAWATHPAFTFAGEQLNGLWVGKFETTGSTVAPTIKPNLKSQISQAIGVQYDISKSIGVIDGNATGGNGTIVTQNFHNLSQAKTHQLKNSDWGAVAYLSSSIYGAGPNNVQANGAYKTDLQDGNGNTGNGITGCGPDANGTTNQYTITDTATTGAVACTYGGVSHSYQTNTGVLASSTNNVYGIYDLSGGAWDYVMGNYATSFTANMGTMPNADYFNNYPSSIFTGNHTTNNNKCTWATCGGHALHETKTVQAVSDGAQSWGADYSNFVLAASPWFARGGHLANGTLTGVFASSYNDGSPNAVIGFRVVLGEF